MYHAKPDHHTPSLIHGDWISESLQIGVEDHWFVLIHQLPVRVQILLNRRHAVFVCCCWPSKHRGRAYVSEASAWEKQARRFFFCSGFWLLRIIVWLWRAIQYPTGSMYVILTYICQTNGPNLGKYIYIYTWILWVWRSKNNTFMKHWLMYRGILLVLFDVGIGSNHQASLIHFINWMLEIERFSDEWHLMHWAVAPP